MGSLTVPVLNQEGEVVWLRHPKGGLACRDHVVDGTQEQIIEALRNSLGQAEAERLLFDVSDRVANVSRPAA